MVLFKQHPLFVESILGRVPACMNRSRRPRPSPRHPRETGIVVSTRTTSSRHHPLNSPLWNVSRQSSHSAVGGSRPALLEWHLRTIAISRPASIICTLRLQDTKRPGLQSMVFGSINRRSNRRTSWVRCLIDSTWVVYVSTGTAKDNKLQGAKRAVTPEVIGTDTARLGLEG